MLCSALLAVQKVYGEIWKQVSNWRLCSVWPNPSLHRESLNCWRSLPPGWSTQLIVLQLSPYRCVFDNVETVTISFSLCSPFVWQRNCLSWTREENSCSDFFFFFRVSQWFDTTCSLDISDRQGLCLFLGNKWTCWKPAWVWEGFSLPWR